jgi:Glyoxalase superfamily protein
MDVRQTVPILRIFDTAKAREFYLDHLGFTAAVLVRLTGLEQPQDERKRKNGNRLRFNQDLR